MTKKFTAHKARDASLARKIIGSSPAETSSIPRATVGKSSDRWTEREEEGLARVRHYQAMDLEGLHTSRIEHESALLDIDLQLAAYGAKSEWAETAQCAIRHRKVNLLIIERVIKAKTSQDRNRDALFVAAATKVFEREDIREIWDTARALDPTNPCWAKEG